MGKHYIPQHYLRAFAMPGDHTQVWMFDKLARDWRVAAVKRVAQERDYYSPEDEARLTREVENPGNRALDALRAGSAPSPDHRADLGRYLAVMMMRVPRKRRFSQGLIPGVIDEVVTGARHEIEGLDEAGDSRRAWLLGELDRVRAKFEREPPQEVLDKVASPWPADGHIEAVSRMTWRFVRAPHHSFGFVTSDNPAHFFEAYGVGTAESELVFPISPTLALHGSHQGAPGATLFHEAKSWLVKEINRRVASGAERFVFAHRRAPWIATLATRERPYLSRTVWEPPA